MLNFRGNVEEALRSQKITVTWTPDSLGKAKVPVEFGMRAPGFKTKVLAAALGVEAERHGNRLQERRFAASVLPDKERHLGMEVDTVERPKRRQAERIAVERRDLVP